MNLQLLKPALGTALLFWSLARNPAGGISPSARFQYSRGVEFSTGHLSGSRPGQACAVLDAAVFAHAAPSLKDLRLYRGKNELPYAITISEPQQQDSDEARILNLTARSGHLFFDLEMPHRPYTGIKFDLAAQDFIASARVSGSGSAGKPHGTELGVFTLFDLTSQDLSRSTSIPLSESTFPYLHVALSLVPAPGSSASAASLNVAETVRGATVPPSREAQTLYVTALRQSGLIQEGKESVATFIVPPRVPIERIAFTLASGYKGNFSRAVKIEARAIAGESLQTGIESKHATPPDDNGRFEEATGNILRLHKTESGRELSAEVLTVPVAIGSNMQQPAVVRVKVEDGDDAPLPIKSVALQMRERRICFDAASAAPPLTLYYGDASLDAPVYDDVKLSSAAANPIAAQLAPEVANPAFKALPARGRLAHQEPVLRWIALLGCVFLFALLAIRYSHKRRQQNTA